VSSDDKKPKSPDAENAVRNSAYFDIQAIVSTLPESSDTMLVDTRLTDEPAASSRIFRAYHPVPRHYHATCDEYLYLLSGRTTFEVDYGEPRELRAGQMVFFKKGVVHAIPELLEHPVVFLTVDTPRRDPRDVIFVNAEEGTVDTFIKAVPK
jgi:mannose-6-phosphate isomerase-like protein (cupin superfamily)